MADGADTGSDIGLRLKSLRLAKGITQAELAGEQLPVSLVSSIERGRAEPVRRVVRILARTLDCSPLYLSHGISDRQVEALRTDLAAARDAAYRGRPDDAVLRYERALTDPVLALLPELQEQSIGEYADALEARGDFVPAIERLKDLAVQTLPGERTWGLVHSALTRCYRRAGDIGAAIHTGENALEEIMRRRGQLGDAGAEVATQLLPAYVANGDQLAGKRLVSRLIDSLGFRQDAAARFAAHWHIAAACGAWGDTESVLFHADEAYRIALDYAVADPRRLATSYATLLLDTGLAAPARRALRALSIPSMAWDDATPGLYANRQILLSRASRILGDSGRAIDSLQMALSSLPGSVTPRARSAVFTELARTFALEGRHEEATDALEEAVSLLEQTQAAKDLDSVTAVIARSRGPTAADVSGLDFPPSETSPMECGIVASRKRLDPPDPGRVPGR